MKASHESSNLDVLRDTAVLLVLFAHLMVFWGVPLLGRLTVIYLGLLGVLLFFVHTSLVLMFSLERQTAKMGPRHAWLIFMIRRCFRVYPLSMLIVTVIFFAKIPAVSLGTHTLKVADLNWWGYIANLGLFQNLTNATSVVGPLWSLPYEMQMYVLLPALFWFALRLRSVWGLLVLWLCAVSLALVQMEFGRIPDFVKYVPCFLPGIIAFKLSKSAVPRIPFAFLPVLLAVWSVLFGITPKSVQYPVAWLICLFTGILLPQFIEVKSSSVKLVSHLLAKYSYGIYIAHYVCIWAAFMALQQLPLPVQWVVFWGLMVGLPAALYHTVEGPMIKYGNTLTKRMFAERQAPRPEAANPGEPELSGQEAGR